MAYQQNDIERYLRGELSAAEMHALEQRALKDPFLAEALEGAQEAGIDNFSLDIHQLRHSIHQKTKRKATRTISLNGWGLYLGIAAGLLLLAVSSFIVFTMIRQQRETSPIAANDQKTTPAPAADSIQADTATNAIAATDTAIEQAPSESTPQKKERAPGATTGSLSNPVAEKPNQGDQSLAENTNIQTQPVVEEPVSNAGAAAQQEDIRISLPEKIIRGRVLAKEDNTALPGVNVVIKGTNKGTITDGDGNFEIPVSEADKSLVFSFIGLTSQEVNVENANNLRVQMQADPAQLSEVVVTGRSVVSEHVHPAMEMAEPEGGRKAFKQYLEEQLQYPKQALANEIEGRVTVEFTVQPNGQLSDFVVLKGVGYGLDEELIRLIKDGPTWTPTKKDDQPVEDNVRIRLRFRLPEKK